MDVTIRLFALHAAILLGVVFGPLTTAIAQIPAPDRLYEPVPRPLGVRYEILETEHFQVIFQQEAEAEARQAAAILEQQLSSAQELTGHSRVMRMPVVLNAYNDRSNGFVMTLPFRQEIETAGIAGHRLSARYLSWMQAVMPHELIHATHAQSDAGFGVGRLLRLISPDLARSLNLGLPPGLSEGAAVYYESTIQEGAGRLNYSLFQMKFRAAMASKRPWSLAQVLEAPAYTYPWDRHYSGGANLFAHLVHDDGGQFFRSVKALHYRLPILGTGVELWHGTGKMPHRLGRNFRETIKRQEEARQDALGEDIDSRLVATGPGRRHRRPQWLNDSTVVMHVSGYDMRTGFYQMDLSDSELRPIAYETITEPATFSLSSDSSSLLFSRYVRDRHVASKWVADAFELDLTTGKAHRLTHGKRLLFPVKGRGVLWALQNRGQFATWVRIETDGEVSTFVDGRRAGFTFVQVAPSPDGTTVAVVVRWQGHQDVYRATWNVEGGAVTLEPWIAFNDGSVYDLSWHGEVLLFTADPGGVANIFAVAGDQIIRLTNARYGAMEPSLSPDGKRLIYVEYQHERYDLKLLPFDGAKTWPVSRDQLRSREPGAGPQFLPSATGTITPYRASRYLGPRTLLPNLRDSGNGSLWGGTLGLGPGLTIQGGDPLRKWAYSIGGYYQAGRTWYTIHTATHLGRVRVDMEGYTDPGTALVFRGPDVPPEIVGREYRGASLGLSLPIYLESNVRSTAARIGIRSRLEASRLFALPGQVLPQVPSEWLEFKSRWVLSPAAYLRYRTVQNARDLIPNRGTTLSVWSDIDLWEGRARERQGLVARMSQYFSLSLHAHTGVRLRATLIAQSDPWVYDLGSLVPRGYDSNNFAERTYAGLDAFVIQPLWYVDNGLVILPVYLKALYMYGFAEALQSTTTATRYRSAGLGLGVQFRLLHHLDLELRFGGVYLFDERRFAWTLR